MNYVLYFSQSGRQELLDVVKVRESKKQIRFIFADGLALHVLKKYLLYYELSLGVEPASNQSVEEVLNHFDDFVDRFVCRVEQTINHRFSYTKPRTGKKYNQLMLGYATTNLVKAIEIKP